MTYLVTAMGGGAWGDGDALDSDELRRKYNQTFMRWIQRSKDVFVQFDLDFCIKYANLSFYHAFVVTSASSLDYAMDRQTLNDALTTEWHELLLKAVVQRREQSAELWLPTRRGARCFQLRLAPEFGMGWEVSSVWTNGRDITDIRSTQNVLCEKEARFRGVATNIPGVVFQLSQHSPDHPPEFLYVSDGSISLCGLAPELMLIKADEFVALLAPDDREAFFRSMNSSFHALDDWFWEGQLSKSGHGLRWVSLRATPRRKKGGGVLWDGIMLDITDGRINAEKLRKSEEFLRDLCVDVALVREEEKRMIAHEIHDDLGQLLTALKLDLSCLHELDGLEKRASPKLRRMESLADEILHRVRNIASTLRPKVLDLGLAPAIEWLAQEFKHRTGAQCELALEGLELCCEIDDAKTTAIFRIVQESLTNIARHADANQVEILFSPHPHGLVLSIRDNGVGFDPSAVEITKIGLSGIRERAIILGAELRIDSSPQGGTIVEAHIPFKSLGRDCRAAGIKSSGRLECC